MTISAVEQQIAVLRSNIRFAAHMHRWFLVGAAAGAIVAIYFWHPVPLMIAVFLLLIGLSERQAGPNIVAAVSAYDSGTPTLGSVGVVISSGDVSNHYHATVHEADCADWEYEFVPQGWQPDAQDYPARIWRIARQGQPVLVVVEDGIMVPRYRPSQNERGR
jgi:hypothetical protein